MQPAPCPVLRPCPALSLTLALPDLACIAGPARALLLLPYWHHQPTLKLLYLPCVVSDKVYVISLWLMLVHRKGLGTLHANAEQFPEHWCCVQKVCEQAMRRKVICTQLTVTC